jgi:molybdopterin synthase catalytic subunit
MAIVVKVQTEDFDAGAEVATLGRGKPAVGAIASFVGLVRDHNVVDHRGTTVEMRADARIDAPIDTRVDTLTLEHYPGMTERSLERICIEACARWQLIDALVIHRYGRLRPTDRIVLVATSSAHRADAFDACRYVMDYLKTDAPFWKKESGPAGERWVEARVSDQAAAERWRSARDEEVEPDGTKQTT